MSEIGKTGSFCLKQEHEVPFLLRVKGTLCSVFIFSGTNVPFEWFRFCRVFSFKQFVPIDHHSKFRGLGRGMLSG